MYQALTSKCDKAETSMEVAMSGFNKQQARKVDYPSHTSKGFLFRLSTSRYAFPIMFLVIILVMIPIISFMVQNGLHAKYTSNNTGSNSPSTQAPFAITVTSKQTPIASTELDKMVRQTLDSITQYGWDTANQGVHINWYRNNPYAQQNPYHDGQNDLRDYEVMVWYEARHPGDTSQQAAIARLLPTVKAEWGRSTLPKGWIYFLFQRLAQYSGNTVYWTNAMENWAAAVYKGIDPAMGVPHGPVNDSTAANAPTCPDGYRVDQNLENGLALIDAGKRFSNQAWMQAGAREVSSIMQQAFVSKYHLFARIVCQGTIWNWEAKPGDYGQEIDALLKAGVYTNNQAYLSVAKQMLDEVANPATGLRDLKNGGIYYKFLLDTGSVDTSRKEMRQFAVLQALHEANAIFHNRYASFEADMIRAVKSSFFAPPVAGWMAELNPNWSLYKGKENWISVEASGMAMEAIQTVLSQ